MHAVTMAIKIPSHLRCDPTANQTPAAKAINMKSIDTAIAPIATFRMLNRFSVENTKEKRMRAAVATMELHIDMVSVTKKMAKTAWPARVAMPLSGSSPLYPPGRVKAAVKVTVIMRVAMTNMLL